jgi:hypothetical protein
MTKEEGLQLFEEIIEDTLNFKVSWFKPVEQYSDYSAEFELRYKDFELTIHKVTNCYLLCIYNSINKRIILSIPLKSERYKYFVSYLKGDMSVDYNKHLKLPSIDPSILKESKHLSDYIRDVNNPEAIYKPVVSPMRAKIAELLKEK